MKGFLAAGCLSPLGLIKAAVAKGTPNYKALVCIYLSGGNDAFNTIVPGESSSYQEYYTSRPMLAVNRDELLPLNLGDTHQLSLHPNLPDIQSLFNQNKATAIINSGTLIEPGSKNDFKAGNSRKPPFLFAHNSQQKAWHSGWENSLQVTGWAGRMMDILANHNAAVSPNITLAGNPQWLQGNSLQGFHVPTSGLKTYSALSGNSRWAKARSKHFDDIIALPSQQLLKHEYKRFKQGAREAIDTLGSALGAAADLSDQFPKDNPLGKQLAMIARLISVHNQLGSNRQVFYAQLGGFDTHANQLSLHPSLLKTFNDAVSAFQTTLDSWGMSDQVTTFTMSDFGRRILSNSNNGSDHGWAGHQFVIGGAVTRPLVGKWPSLEVGSENDLNKGRIIPSIGSTQVSATLAQWFGVPPEIAGDIFPNLNNFNERNLGFLG